MAKAQNSHIAKDLRPLATPIAKLKLDPNNARLHSERNTVATMRSLLAFGQQKPIVILKDGTVIAGNGTVMAAKRIAAGDVPFDKEAKPDARWESLAASKFDSAAEARAYAIADNRTAELAEWDFETLADTFKSLPEADYDATGFLDYEIAPMLEADWTPPQKEELPDRKKTNSISLSDEEWDVFNKAVAAIPKAGKDLTRGEALVIICKGYLK